MRRGCGTRPSQPTVASAARRPAQAYPRSLGNSPSISRSALPRVFADAGVSISDQPRSARRANFALRHSLFEGRAEWMRRIHAEDLHFFGVERELLECEHQAAILGMTFDIGIKLGGEEIAFEHVAFELGHVDAVSSKAAERLVERRRHVAHPE